MHSYPWLKSYPSNLRWDVAIEERPLPDLLDNAKKKYGARTAIDFMGRAISYAELADNVERLAAGLQEMGVTTGVNVGLFMPNCPQFVMSYYAILKAGGTVVNYNPLYSLQDLRHQIEDSSTEIMVTLALAALYPKVAECLGGTKLKKIIVSDFYEALPLPKRLAFQLTRKKEIIHAPDDGHHVFFKALLETKSPLRPVAIHPDSHVAVLQYTGGDDRCSQGRRADPWESLCQYAAVRHVVCRP